MSMEAVNARARWWPRCCRVCFSCWRKSGKKELFEMHICLEPAVAHLMFRPKWGNWDTASLSLHCIAERSWVFRKSFLTVCQVLVWSFCIAMLLKGWQFDSETISITKGLNLRFFVGMCLFSWSSYLYGLKSVKTAQFFLMTSNSFDSQFEGYSGLFFKCARLFQP